MGEICLSTGWFVLLFWVVASVGAILGFGLCAVLTMGKRADKDMARLRTSDQSQHNAGSKDTA